MNIHKEIKCSQVILTFSILKITVSKPGVRLIYYLFQPRGTFSFASLLIYVQYDSYSQQSFFPTNNIHRLVFLKYTFLFASLLIYAFHMISTINNDVLYIKNIHRLVFVNYMKCVLLDVGTDKLCVEIQHNLKLRKVYKFNIQVTI